MDDQLRTLEATWQRTQSADDELPLLRARLRAGALDVARLEIATWCGHEGAKSLLPPGSWKKPPGDERAKANWVAERGPWVSVVVGYWFVRAGLERSEKVLARRVGVEVCLAAHAAILAWISDPGPTRLAACLAQEQALRSASGQFKLKERFQQRTREALGVLLAMPEDPRLLENVLYLLLISGSYGEPQLERGPEFRRDVAAWVLGHSRPSPLNWKSALPPAKPALSPLEPPPPWETLAESERWRRVVGLSRKWHATPLSPADGMSAQALAEAQQALDAPLPRALVEWLALAGERLPLIDLEGLTPGFTVWLAEDQYLRYWIRREDAALADPPVYTYDGNDEEAPEAASLSEFFLLEILSQALALPEFEEDLLLGPHADHVRRGRAGRGSARKIQAELAPLFPEVSPSDPAAEVKRALFGDADTIARTEDGALRLALRAGRSFPGVKPA